MKKIIVIALVIGIPVVSLAQDTTKKKTIDITSTFKPVLREPSKVNFNAAPLVSDTTPPVLKYNIPAENLLFTYQPADLKPLTLDEEGAGEWAYSNYIKAGIGNVHLPYLKAGFSFGNGENTFVNLFADHYSSKGSLEFQRHSLTKIGATLTHKTASEHEWNAGLGYTNDNYFLYGFRPDSLKFTKDQLRQRFQTFEARVGFKNIVPTNFGLSYSPSAKIAVFSDNHANKTTESNAVFDLPVQKNFGKSTAFNLGVTADLTNYRNEQGLATVQNNNILMVSPTVLLKTPNLFLHGGVIPSWERGNFNMLPNVMADITTNDQRLTLQLGWIGYYNKGSYQRFASINPWLAQPDSLVNTKVTEIYGGIKGSLSDHFSYSAKIGHQQHRNMPMFINDDIDGKTFDIVYESKLNILQTHAEAEYRIGEKFNAKAIFNWNIFNERDQLRPWGLLPMELNTSLRWQVVRDLFLRADLWMWDGAQFMDKQRNAFKGKGGFDLGAGAEFRINRNFNIWLQMNNIMNNKYERWNQYQVFGFNILGGIIYSFNK